MKEKKERTWENVTHNINKVILADFRKKCQEEDRKQNKVIERFMDEFNKK